MIGKRRRGRGLCHEVDENLDLRAQGGAYSESGLKGAWAGVVPVAEPSSANPFWREWLTEQKRKKPAGWGEPRPAGFGLTNLSAR